jgi:hypothetical protein
VIFCVLETPTSATKAVVAKDSIRIENMMSKRNQGLGGIGRASLRWNKEGGFSFLYLCRDLSFLHIAHKSAHGGEVHMFTYGLIGCDILVKPSCEDSAIPQKLVKSFKCSGAFLAKQFRVCGRVGDLLCCYANIERVFG